ncbi:Fic family protein [Curtobacterium sp. A7_M15]|uniref:Fic family protein n=1 Tax=Curtobacterium sp. A7_M15 TaxID=3065241 RepID=UPI002737D082|nr:Fic family protein [Curtobacterium sp. A7_M15]MDP4332555.1 Fic family protein [Curtobacterium sp. A7_M15]
MPRTEHPWPSHTTVTLPWRSGVRGPRHDRETTSVVASIPPRIARLPWAPDADTAALLDRAAATVADLDGQHGDRLAVLGRLLARTDAVASSRIEDEHATLDDLARAVVGVRSNQSATVMVRAGAALETLVSSAASGMISEQALLAAHLRLMRDDPLDGRYAGRWRDVQNWIGGGATPRLARHVPPPPALVPELMDDLFEFLHRDDLHPIAQAAIAHAQFESIHPFTDGNGRIGRALVAAVLRRRGLARVVAAPVATALVAERDRYFWHLDRYRRGAVDEWVRDLAIALGTVCDEATVTALLLDEAAVATPPVLRAVDDPVVTEDRLEQLLGDDSRTIDTVTDDLCRAGVLRPATERRRRRAWVAVAVADELTAFPDRVHDAVTHRANRVGW